MERIQATKIEKMGVKFILNKVNQGKYDLIFEILLKSDKMLLNFGNGKP